MTLILDGRKVRDERVAALKEEISKLKKKPTLAIIQIGDSERSDAYINQKKKFALTIGAVVKHLRFPVTVLLHEVADKIESLNQDGDIQGIIIQLPIPTSLDQAKLVEAVDSEKDVDGLTSTNLKKLILGDDSGFIPATAKGVMALLDFYKIPIEGKKAVVVGRSMIVGKPVALSLLNRNATVTICHSLTSNLEEVTRQADILIVGVGKPRFIGKKHVKKDMVVIDVGINVLSGEKLEEEIIEKKLVGDVDFDSVKDMVSAISPVPGGVGPMTVLSLFENLVESAKREQAG